MKKLLAFAAIAAVSALSAPCGCQNPAGGAPSAPRRVVQGGTGPVRMLLITKAHAYEREPCCQMFDSIEGRHRPGSQFNHPAAEAFVDAEVRKPL